MQHPFHLMPDMLVGSFRIQARLGAGGFGAVFRVEHSGELFALKFAVHGPESEDLNLTDARAERELACLLLVRHPNVVRVWAHGRWPHPRTGYHYVVMDYVEGPTLFEWVKKTRPPLRQVLRVFDTLALTLEALHGQGLHHRDLKGSNILVRQRDGAPVLVDFGAAEHPLLAVPLTEGPLPPGTPHLRTPEAVRFHREQYADPHARYAFQPSDDLYALGCTLYEVLTGAPAFPPTLPREVLTSLIEKEMPASPAVLNPQVPAALAELVLRLLAKRPEERPESGRALHEQLQGLLRGDTPGLDEPLVPGAQSATTEGMGGPAEVTSLDNPERPLLGLAKWGESRASPEPTSPREARAPEPTERASPGSPRPGRRVAVGAVVLALVAALGVVLWRGEGARRGPAETPVPSTVASSERPPTPAMSEPPRAARFEDAGLPSFAAGASSDAGVTLVASASSDAGLPAPDEVPSTTPHQKGVSMRMRPPAKSPAVPREPEKPRSEGSHKASTLAGVVAACALAGGCASPQPAVRPGPPPLQPCPPGAAEVMRNEFGIDSPDWDSVLMPGVSKDAQWTDHVVVTDGRNEVTLRHMNFTPKIPRGSKLVGDFFVRDRLYARFVEVRFPDGRRFPFCGFLKSRRDDKRGAIFVPESKPGAMMVEAIQEFETTEDEH